jgi:hypothetical protein
MLCNKQHAMTKELRTMFDLSPPVPGDVLLTPGEVSAMARLTKRALANRRSRGRGPAYVKLSPGRTGHVRYWRSTVTDWLTNRTVDIAS